MGGHRKTLLMAVLSWVLPVLALVSPAVLRPVFRPFAAGRAGGAWAYVITSYSFSLGSLAAACALAVVARKRSARSRASGPYRHATVGLLVSLALLTCLAAALVFDVVSMWSRT